MFLTVALVVTVAVLLLGYFHHRHQYWQAKGVFVPPMMPIIGHLLVVFSATKNRFQFVDEILKKTKAPFIGIYEGVAPSIVVRDIALLKSILVKDFDHFVDRRTFALTSADQPAQEMLFLLEGEKWKALRSIMSPTFTSGKLKGMFPLMEKKCKKLVEFLSSREEKSDTKWVFSRFALDTIATCAFGFESNFVEDEDDDFGKQAMKFVETPGIAQALRLLGSVCVPWLFRWLNIRVFDPVSPKILNMPMQSIRAREGKGKRGDFLDLMMEAKVESENNTSKKKYNVTDDTVTAQSVLFLFAGMETTSTTLSFTSYLLAKHPEVQKRLRKELHDLSEAHGGLNYQALGEAKFLEACINESTRLYPPAPFTERKCTKDYTFPGTDLTIEKGTHVGVPTWTIHRDSNVFEDPEAFRPERFLPENRTPDTSFALLTFGQGPRNCIGFRFALLEVKLAIAHLVLNLEFLPVAGCQEPFVFKPSPNEILTARDGVFVRFRPLQSM